MPFKHDEEKIKLIERLKNELPENIESLWDENTNTLIFQAADGKKLLFSVKYGCPEYPESNDADFYIRRAKMILNQP